MSTRSSRKWRDYTDESIGFHLYDDLMDDDRDGEPPVYLQLDGVHVELATCNGGASVTVMLPREAARELGLVPAVARGIVTPQGAETAGLRAEGIEPAGEATRPGTAAAAAPEPVRAATDDARDTERLDWLLHHLSGKEMRRLYISTSSGGPLWGRVAIDAAIAASDGAGTSSAGNPA